MRMDKGEQSGFLADCSVSREGKEGETNLVYWDEGADFKAYDKIVVDSVTSWLAADADLKNASPEERRQLANEFHAAIIKEMEADFKIIDSIEPGTLRVRIALTDAEKSNPALDTIST